MKEKIIWVEDRMWYDGIAYYKDEETWKRFSRNWNPIEDNEMCKPWWIYKIKLIKDWDWPFDYHYKILDKREDINNGNWEA